MISTIVTPVCKSFKTEEQRQQGISDSRRDYEEQLQRDKNGEQIMWDDAKGNPTKHSGGFFAFVKNGKCAEIHIVTKICRTDERLDTWSRNVGHSDRNVLMLSPKIMEIDWQTWSKQLLITPKMERGTRPVRTKTMVLTNFIKENLKFTFDPETEEIILE